MAHPPQRGDYLKHHPFIKHKGKEIKAEYVTKYFRGGTFIMYDVQMDRAYVRSCQYQRNDSL